MPGLYGLEMVQSSGVPLYDFEGSFHISSIALGVNKPSMMKQT
ncbi:Uncharacterised protein [Mycobacteroides abscessus subsp. abscessus]|uniref:Uncharacterized protein n=1 Tax=Mycobacteroides abscessus 1948 TaxID=1299323 RepID=A0A829QCG4_9MYCO|nr:hypothetical protein MA6G0125R_0856 [Mycobacteroides abscessus 6G-0125-R]EIU49184.1 hypothetical protein MA6G0125S_1830 [Mycobacteroides abscessus 6G-0125-S]EIU59868.1 hypothetical protein MA6G0728S_0719 [Mycobacteroides abscessus 6G-0728-S]EIU64763.1 hypothetical protein MA6G1108_1816 [Mycobacteroides abscessus 6G-1108]EIU96902.1 hypothetical protein MA6G0212_1881 [Mycobacteroides abscessus 6G-0212]EIV00032.1 hypothetical protein MA6G0728R_1819 [Mycobacteroides abscessus 6G-0728-R]EIV6832